MKQFLIILIIAFPLGIISCGGDAEEETNEEEGTTLNVDPEEFMKDFNALNDKINANLANPDHDLLRQAVTTYQDYAVIFPENADAPDYLLKASDFAYTTKQPEKAVKLLERIMADYPDYMQMESVMFNHASHLDFELRDTSRAKKSYEEFIAAFPNSIFVPDAQSRIDNMSLNIDQLADEFMKALEAGEADTVGAL